MARTPAEAIAWALERVGKSGWDNLCLSFVRQAFGVDYTPASAWPTSERQAGRAWDRAQHKHPTSDPDAIPRGVPVFWELATEADHVALSLGDGWCLSNDFIVDGRIDRVRIADITARWGRLLGWTEDLVGNRVVPKPAAPKGMRVDGVDISHHQAGAIDYAAAKKAGVKWLYHKATEGATYVDPNFSRRREQANAAGIPFGAYHFARAGVGDAVTEAKHFLAVAAPKPGDLRPALDLETTEGLSITQLRTWAAAFVAEVKRQTGVLPVIYTPFDLGDSVKDCVIWRPRYNDDNRPPALPWDIWQFSNGVLGHPDHVAGFGYVDLNTMRAGLELDDLLVPKRKPKKRRRWRGPITLAWYNVGDGPDRDKESDLDDLVADGAVVIALAEAGDRTSLLIAWARKNGWVLYLGDGTPGAASTPILARKDVPVGHWLTTEAVPETKVGSAGAGPADVKRKVTNEARIRRATSIGLPRRPLDVLTAHLVASATRRKLPNADRRRALYRRHIAALVATARRRPIGRKLIVGDFNATRDDQLLAALRVAGFEALATDSTHWAQIDIAWMRRLGCIERVVLVALSSDHKAVLLTIR